MRTDGSFSKIIRLFLIALVLAYSVYLLAGISRQAFWSQWDFRIYYLAARAYQMDLDPYQTESLSMVADAEVILPFAYPPSTLWFFKLFSAFDLDTARQIWLFLKVALLAGLLYLWRRYFLSEGGILPLALFMLLAFDAAIYFDFKTGNVSIIEQILLWLAFLAYIRRKLLVFCILVLGASMFKWLMVGFLLLLLLGDDRHRWRWLAGAAAGVVLLIALNYLPDPDLFRSYLTTVGNIEEGAVFFNYGVLPFMVELCRELPNHGIAALPRWVPYLLYGAVVVTVPLVTAKAAGWTHWCSVASDRRLLVLVACIVFALIAPRMKCYSLILVLPAAYYIIRVCKSVPIFPLAFLLLVLTVHRPLPEAAIINRFSYYYLLFMVFMVWLLYISHLSSLVRGSDTPVVTDTPGA